ncbi:ADP-ribosyltransferase domain-containing protein [Paraflavitalea sp. CAU 1676]|uniref:ADP-ribosyltransferase domain-containing protein n=1 Tax=Paraflavitalea sp. CAU 1676 TaxID=3032598 RepID=UPI0023DB05B3|nr:ADP-ribosyltransferase domain-containing protein [Paraflavitalea sp. CAU 1676]MDF2192572.1 ADP-ribosyltransferase domain-containing protein [Paraflavitalea sp. CAU 1676]
MALQIIDSLTIDNAVSTPQLQLCMGDLTNLSPADQVDFLVVSSVFGNYTPCSTSLIGSLNQAGISVQTLAQNKAASYAPNLLCWISQTISSSNPGIQFSRILVYERPLWVEMGFTPAWQIFQALNCFQASTSTSVAIPMVSAGSGGGASLPFIMQMLFYAAVYAGSLPSYPLSVIKLVAYNSSQLAQVQPIFAALKSAYLGLIGLPNLPGDYLRYAPAAWIDIQGINLPATLSRRQAFALRVYTSEYHRVINHVLRNPNDPNYAAMMPLFSTIDSGLSNIPRSPGMTYRGEHHMSAERISQYSPGLNIRHQAYTSSQRPAGAIYNAANYKFNINGVTARQVAFLSEYPAENEYIYHRSMLVNVTSQSCNPTKSQCTFGVTETPINYCSSSSNNAAITAQTEIF